MVPPRGYLFAICCHTDSFLSESIMKWRLLWAATLLRPLCILGALETRMIRCLHESFSPPCPPNASHYSVGYPSTVLRRFWHDVRHWLKEIRCWNETEINTRCTWMNLCVGRNCPWHTPRYCRSLPLSFMLASSCWTTTLFDTQHRFQSVHWSLPK